jgi:GT2 family glycosyltransferase
MPESPALSLSAVVCAYTLDRWDDLSASLQSLAAQTLPVAQILLVCDHNPELAARARAELLGLVPQLEVLDNTGARGLSGARNTGVAAASGAVVAFLDDDAAADPTWAARMLAAYEDADVVGVGGGVVPAWRTPRPAWFPDEFLWVVGCSYRGQPTARTRVRNAIGANMSFRRAVLAEIAGFDSSVGRIGKDAGGCEETELSIRATRAREGGRILLEPSSVCRHTVTADRTTLRYFVRRCAAEGRAKAVVAGLVGAGDALDTERTYTRQVLPRGVAAGLRELGHGDLDGGRRATMIVVGLAVTATSYLRTRRTLARTRASGGAVAPA